MSDPLPGVRPDLYRSAVTLEYKQGVFFDFMISQRTLNSGLPSHSFSNTKATGELKWDLSMEYRGSINSPVPPLRLPNQSPG